VPRVDAELVQKWIATQLAEDDLVSGQVPGVSVVDKHEIRPPDHLTPLHSQNQTEVQIDLPLRVPLDHALDHAASGEPFVRRLATQILADADGPAPEVIAAFEGKLLAPFVPKLPAALIFATTQRGVPALQTIRVPVRFSVALGDGEVVVVERGSEARYSIGEGGTVDVPPHLVRVFLPTLLYRLGTERVRIRRLIIGDPSSIAIPRHGRLPF
jgi:hypothetical protein